MGPIVLMFGLNPGQGAVSTSLTRVRGADGNIQGSVGVAQGRGEDVCGPQVRARDETGNLHFSSVIALLRCCMQKGRDGVVSPCGLPKGAAGGVRCARIQNARVAGGASDGFHGATATQTKTNRINVLIGFQNQAVTRVEPPQPSVVYRGVAKLRKTRASSPRPFIFMHLQQTLADSGVKARSDDALDLGSLPRVRVLIVTITVIRRDATSMARSRETYSLRHRVFLMSGWVCEWKAFWIPVGDTIQKAYLEEKQRVDDRSICDPGECSIKTVPCAAESARQRRVENSDYAIKYGQPFERTLSNEISIASSWRI